MNARPSRGEIWQVDMGIAGKVRPPKLMRQFGSLTHEEWNMTSAKLAKRLGLVF
jgi:hypothetical protein